MEFKLSVNQEDKALRRSARQKVTNELLAKRQGLVARIGRDAWGHRFYNSKEIDSSEPPPEKDADLLSWPSGASTEYDQATKNTTNTLSKLLCELDDDWSGMVRLVFIMLDCYNGGTRYRCTVRPHSPGRRAAKAVFINSTLDSVKELLKCVEEEALKGLQQHVSSPWYQGLLHALEEAASQLDVLVTNHSHEEGTSVPAVANRFFQITATVRLLRGALLWLVDEILRRGDELEFEGTLISKAAVEDIELKLSQLCRCLGKTRRDDWVDEESQRAAGHLIIVSKMAETTLDEEQN